jgi:hypothetical protein
MQFSAFAPEDIEIFTTTGYVVLRDAVPEAVVSEWVDWCEHRIEGWKQAHASSMPPVLRLAPILGFDVRDVAPRIWDAAMDLLGGPDRVVDRADMTDGFIINSPLSVSQLSFEEACSLWQVPRPDSREWHIDGDWFRHFLDSPEWNLTALISWTESRSKSGATLVVPRSQALISRYLLEHPEGIDRFNFGSLLEDHFEWAEVEMLSGDVLFLHPHLLHCSSQNVSRSQRIISSCMFDSRVPLTLGAGTVHSPVEEAILRGIGRESISFQRTRDVEYASSKRAVDYQQTLTAERETLRRLLS